jgi:hypothetical protein
MFDSVVSLDLINGFATNRTKPNMNPPMAVPYITEADTSTQLSVAVGASFHMLLLMAAGCRALVASGYPLLSCLRNVAKLKNV